jgi:hypothetical protein
MLNLPERFVDIAMPLRPFEALQLVLDIDAAGGLSRRWQAFRYLGHHCDSHCDMKPVEHMLGIGRKGNKNSDARCVTNSGIPTKPEDHEKSTLR